MTKQHEDDALEAYLNSVDTERGTPTERFGDADNADTEPCQPPNEALRQQHLDFNWGVRPPSPLETRLDGDLDGLSEGVAERNAWIKRQADEAAKPAERGVNPKDLQGAKKPDVTLIPSSAIMHMAMAMQDGADKYDPYNWRQDGQLIQARTYVAAGIRHLRAWLDGEELAEDSQAHHLGHAASCCAILLDAIDGGFLADNRPVKGPCAKTIAALTKGSE